MKITFLVSGSVRSNFSYRAVAFARALHKLGHEVSIIAPKADKYNDFRAENINTIDGVKILQPFQFRTKWPEINILPYVFSGTLMALREKSDLIYIYKPTPANIFGFVVKLFRKTAILVDVDDLGSEVMKIEGHPWHQRKLVEWSERFAVKHADRLVVASTYLFGTYKKEFPNKPIHIMPNGAESDWFTPPIPSEEKKRVIFMGSINRKNILEPLFEVLSEVIEEHPDVKILIIGAGKYLEYFRKKSEDLGISSNVTFTGWLNIEEARSHLHTGDIGYSYMPDEPTTRAASNMKVPQYMARGVVPLVSAVGDLPAAVDFGNAGYICEADNAQMLRMTLLHALEDKKRSFKAERARIFAATNFNWDHLAAIFHRWLISEKKEDQQYAWDVLETNLDVPIKMIHNKNHTPYLVQPLPVYFLLGLILVNFIAIFQFDPFYIGSLFAFFYIVITPGFLLLPFLVKKKLAPALGIAFSAALSILMLMLVGLGLNTILPFFGIEQPLTTISLLIAFDAIIYLLLILNFIFRKISPLEPHNFDARNWIIVGLSLLLPVFACLGAISLNNGGSNFFTILSLGLAFLLVLAVIVNRQGINPSTPPITLYMMALAFLLMNSMRGWFITGHDIMLEYHVFNLVNTAHHWSMALYQDPYMACLSLTILPTYLQNLLHVSNAYIFKFFTQFLSALSVVLVYYLAKEYVSETITFLTGFLYISFPTFMVDMAFLNRQGIAFLFFGALIFVLLTAEYFGNRIRTALLFLLGTGMVLSHYSTSYVAIGLFIIAYAVNQVLRLVIHTERYQKPNLLTMPFVIGFFCIMFVWSTLITKTSASLFNTLQQIGANLQHPSLGEVSGPAKYSLVKSQQKTSQELLNQFVQQNIAQARNPGNESNFFPLNFAQSYSTVPIPEPHVPLTPMGAELQSLSPINLYNFFGSIKQVYAKMMQGLLLIGLIGFAVGYGFKKNLLHNVQREYVALGVAGVGILVGQTVLPASAIDYGLLRLFQQNLILLALPITLGLLTVSTIITRNHKGQLLICSGILLFFFVILSGLLPQFTGGARPLLSLNNYGLYYDVYYTHVQEVRSLDWLAKNGGAELPVQSDRYFSNTKMLAYTGIAPLPGLLPETIRKNSYVYLNFNNVKTGSVIDYINGNVIYYHFPSNFLWDNKNLIYNNGGSEIYR